MNEKLLEEVQMLQSSSDRLLLESAEQQRQLVAHYEAVRLSVSFNIFSSYLSNAFLIVGGTNVHGQSISAKPSSRTGRTNQQTHSIIGGK
jgi:hypothetical protein